MAEGYSRTMKHPGLNKFRVIKAKSIYELDEKCSAVKKQWDDQWARKCEIEQKKTQVEWALNKANELTVQAEKVQNDLCNILSTNIMCKLDKSIESFMRKDTYKIAQPQQPTLKSVSRMPNREDAKYNPSINIFAKIIGGAKQSKIKNDMLYNSDLQRWNDEKLNVEESNNQANKLYNQRLEKWKCEKLQFDNEVKSYNQNVNKFWGLLEEKDKDAIEIYFSNIVDRVAIPIEFGKYFDLEYTNDTKILIINYTLPNIEDIPNLKKITYVKTQQNFKEFFQTEAYIKKLYDQVIYQIVLSILDKVFKSDSNFNFLESIVVNGKVQTTDKSTGQEINPYILSVSVKKENFEKLNLSNIDAKEWFKSNKGVSAVTFSSVTPVMPIIQISKEDSRFIDGYGVVDQIDDSTNLAAMDWQDFENLIRELFEKEFNQGGGEVKITQASKDGGVDAVAFDPDPIRGGKIVIQAKRYTNVVGVSAVRDLYGTVMNEGASKGILVSTANYGSDAYEFAKNKPLTLLNGSNLLALLEKHGHNARIDIMEAKRILSNK